MKNIILFTLLLIGNYSFSQENLQEISRERERLEDLANNHYYKKGGKLLFYDIYNQNDRWSINENLSVSELKSKIADLKQVREKWEARNGPLAISLSRIDKFHNYNNKICSTYGAVKTPNSDHVTDWCKIRDNYKRQYPRESSSYKQAMGYWQRFYDYANQLLSKKKNNQNRNTSSNYNSSNSNTSNTASNNSNSNNRNKETEKSDYQIRMEKQRREQEYQAKKTEIIGNSVGDFTNKIIQSGIFSSETKVINQTENERKRIEREKEQERLNKIKRIKENKLNEVELKRKRIILEDAEKKFLKNNKIIEKENTYEKTGEHIGFIIIEEPPVFPECKGNKSQLKYCFSKKN